MKTYLCAAGVLQRPGFPCPQCGAGEGEEEGCLGAKCKDCGLPKEKERMALERCLLCQRAKEAKDKEAGNG